METFALFAAGAFAVGIREGSTDLVEQERESQERERAGAAVGDRREEAADRDLERRLFAHLSA